MALLLIQERWKNKMKVIIVGGVAGGATAAARIRRLDALKTAEYRRFMVGISLTSGFSADIVKLTKFGAAPTSGATSPPARS